MINIKSIIEKVFLLLIISVNLAYLPQSVIAIINNVPLVSSITYSYEYIALGLANDFPLVRYMKDILVILLFGLMFLDFFINKKVKKSTIIVFGSIMMLLLPLSILSLMYSNEFSIFMIIAGIRVIIFPVTIIIFILQYLDSKLITKIYNVIIFLLKIIFVITLLQSSAIITKYNSLNLANYRLIGTFASCGLLGLFGVGAFAFLILYSINLNKKIPIKINALMIGFIIFASGTRTAMVTYLITLISYIYYKKINSNNNKKLTMIFIIISILFGTVALNISEVIAGRGSAIGAQFEEGRITFILDYLNESSVKEILLGKGIGFGTNTALSMLSGNEINIKSSTRVMDGTINILITQFGIITTLIMCILYFCTILKIMRKTIPSEIKLMFIITNIILLLIGNTLEQFSFQILFILNHCLVLKQFKGCDEFD